MDIHCLKDFYKYIVIGSGPAGLQCAYYLQHTYGQDYLILERSSSIGSFFSKYPRLKKLISINKHSTYSFSNTSYDSMRYDWNSLLCENNSIRLKEFTNEFYPSSDDFMKYLEHYKTHFQLHILFDIQVLSIKKSLETNNFILTCHHPSYADPFLISCEYLIVSTGLREKLIPESIVHLSNKMDIELLSYTTFDLNLDHYKNKNIVIVGTGNAAFETANYINNVAMSVAMIGPTKLAWKTHYPGHLRSINMGFIDTLYLKMGNIMYLDKYDTIHAIKLQNEFLKYCNAKVDKIIYCGGFECNFLTLFTENIKPSILPNHYPELTSWYESVNIPKLYFAGALTHGYDYKKGTSGFIHGFRYNIEFTMRYIHEDIHPISLPSKERLLSHILERLNFCSCLHHRHGYYCDYILIWDDCEGNDSKPKFVTPKILYYEKIHISYIPFIHTPNHSIQIQLGFEYGKEEFDWNLKQPGGFNQPDIVIPFRKDISKFLHPVFEIVFRNGKKDTYHVGESPTGQFFHPIYKNYVKAILDLSYTNRTHKDVCEFEKKILDIYYTLNVE